MSACPSPTAFVEGDNASDVLKQLATCGGELLSTDLPAEQAEKLRGALKREHGEEEI